MKQRHKDAVRRALRMTEESRARMNRGLAQKLEALPDSMQWQPSLEKQLEQKVEALSDIVTLADQVRDPEVFRRFARKIASGAASMQLACTVNWKAKRGKKPVKQWHRRRYSRRVREQVQQLLRNGKRPLTIARRLHVPVSTVYSWRLAGRSAH